MSEPAIPVVVDGAFAPGLIAAAVREWPDACWPGWHVYDTPLERKRAANGTLPPPGACRTLLDHLCAWPLAAAFPELAARRPAPDRSFWGAGLHEMGSGDFLAPHLDADVHAHGGQERLANAVLFLDDVPGRWGGYLHFWDAARLDVASSVSPVAGRLVLFRPTAAAVHSVQMFCPPFLAGRPTLRRTLSCFWYAEPLPGWAPARPRALFVHTGAESPQPALEELRRRRALPGG
jgi:hypothetical protein